jgi:hypothetical protein
MSSSESLESVVSVVVQSEGLQDAVAEYVELGIDAFMKEGVGREVPVASTVLAMMRAVRTVRERNFTKKLFAFLGPLKGVTAEERAEMVSRLESDPNYGRKVGDHLVDLLDRIEAHRKPAMIARIFLAYLRKEIDATMLHRLTHAVDQLPAFEIPRMKLLRPDPRAAGSPTLANLVVAGLVEEVVSSPIGGRQVLHRFTVVGEAFEKLNLGDIPA